jgi:hypothetical protein
MTRGSEPCWGDGEPGSFSAEQHLQSVSEGRSQRSCMPRLCSRTELACACVRHPQLPVFLAGMTAQGASDSACWRVRWCLFLSVFHPAGLLLPYLGFSAYGLRGTSVSRFRSETEAKTAKRARENLGAMENRLHETGGHSRVAQSMAESTSPRFGRGIRVREEPSGGIHPCRWRQPQASRDLIRRLMAIVNRRREYEVLRRDLAELGRLCPSSSSSMKGGAAQGAVEETWLR